MENRRQEIVELVNRAGEVSISELKETFPGVSEVTLRKDLRYLDSTLQIVRVHGGAKSLPAAIGTVDTFYTRATKHIEEKKIAAAKAAKLLRPNQSLFIAAGSTCTELAKLLPDIPLQIFTDGLVTAIELAKLPNAEVTMLGGQINRDSVRSSGPKVYEELDQLHFDYVFIGTDGYRPDYGFVCCSAHAYALFRTLIDHADKVVVLMDHSKVQATRAARNIPAAQVDIVAQDGGMDETVIRGMTQAGITVL